MNMCRAFLKFFFARNLENWRELRRQCRAKLPMRDRPLA
jgi:hypothetical protein